MLGIFYLLLFYVLGLGFSELIGHFIPGNVLGMLLLFVALQIGWVKAESIRSTALFLVNNMAFFFVPIGVGLMTSFGLIRAHLVAIVVATILSTILILWVVGFIQQKMGRRKS